VGAGTQANREAITREDGAERSEERTASRRTGIEDEAAAPVAELRRSKARELKEFQGDASLTPRIPLGK